MNIKTEVKKSRIKISAGCLATSNTQNSEKTRWDTIPSNPVRFTFWFLPRLNKQDVKFNY